MALEVANAELGGQRAIHPWAGGKDIMAEWLIHAGQRGIGHSRE